MKLQQALEEQKDSNEPVHNYISGILGIPLGGRRVVEVSNRNSFVYVRLRNNQSEVIQAFNNQVSPSYNLPVLVERQGNRYVVTSVDTQRYGDNWSSFSSFLPRHGNTHSFDLESGGGGDVVWVQSRQIAPLLAMPSGSDGGPNVIINPYTLKNADGSWKYIGNTGTQNLTTYNPAGSNAVMVLVYADSISGNPYILVGSGSYFANSITGTSVVSPYIPSVTDPAHIPLAAVRLVTGTSTIGWDNIYDVRQWLHTTPTGTGGGSSSGIDTLGFAGLDEGFPLGTGTSLNVVGAGATLTRSGTMFNLNIPSSTSITGTSIGYPDRVVLTDGFGNIFTPTWLKWGNGFTNEFVEFGADEVKEENAGKIGYKAFSEYLDIVGAGTGTPRTVKLYDNVIIENKLTSPHVLVTGSLQISPLGGGLPVANLGVDSNGFVVTGTGVEEAPDTGLQYARESETWQVVSVNQTIQDEGVTKGSANVFNFVGGVTASVSGSIAEISVPASALTLIETQTLGNTGTFNFNNIPQTYKTLELDVVARTNKVATSDEIRMMFNNDSANRYSGLVQWGAGQIERATPTGSFSVSFVSAASSPAGWYDNTRITVFGYTPEGFFPNIQARGMQTLTNAPNSFFIYDAQGLYLTHGAITSVQLFPPPSNSFISGSVARLYGRL